MHSRKAVTMSLEKLAHQYQHQLPDKLKNSILSIDVAISIDSVYITVQSKQYYDVTLYCVHYEWPTLVCDETRVRIQNQTILLLEGPSVPSAAHMRTVIDDLLRAHYGGSIFELQKLFKILTDAAAVTAQMAGSSVCCTRSSSDHKWMRCFVHVLNK